MITLSFKKPKLQLVPRRLLQNGRSPVDFRCLKLEVLSGWDDGKHLVFFCHLLLCFWGISNIPMALLSFMLKQTFLIQFYLQTQREIILSWPQTLTGGCEINHTSVSTQHNSFSFSLNLIWLVFLALRGLNVTLCCAAIWIRFCFISSYLNSIIYIYKLFVEGV